MNVRSTPPTTALKTQAHSHFFRQIVEWAFGKRMTPAERLRKHQRALEKTQRELDRERVKLENQEKKLIQDIKKSAKNGQMGACKIQAKDLVRTRRCVTPCLPHKTSALNGPDRQSSQQHSQADALPLSSTPDTYKSSTPCAPNSKPYPSVSKPSAPTNR